MDSIVRGLTSVLAEADFASFNSSTEGSFVGVSSPLSDYRIFERNLNTFASGGLATIKPTGKCNQKGVNRRSCCLDLGKIGEKGYSKA